MAEMPADLKYVVQEKVHGANTSFLCDGNEVKFAKRTSILSEGENFYEYDELPGTQPVRKGESQIPKDYPHLCVR